MKEDINSVLDVPIFATTKEYLVECNGENFITENFCSLKSLQDSLVSICILYYLEYQENVTLTLSFSGRSFLNWVKLLLEVLIGVLS